MALDPMQTIAQIQKFLGGLSPKQRISLGAAVGLCLLCLLVFVFLFSKPEYKPLYSGLQPEEALSIARNLAANNIPYEMSSDGTSLRVPSNKLDSVRMDLAAQGLPETGRLGLELFDKPNWAGSDFAERVNYQRALEGELERTIRSIRQVQSARVHLVMPHDSLFTEREREAKASVVVKVREGRLADAAIGSISYLVASAVDNLRPENVTIIDADGNLPLKSRRYQGGVDRGEVEELENSLSDKLVSTLTPVVGPEGLRANVNVEYDLATNESTQETYDPNGSVLLTSQTAQDQERDEGPQGMPGTPSNVPGSSAQGAAASAATDNAPDQMGERTENKTYAVSKAVRHVVQPPGQIKRVTVAILVDDAVGTTFERGKKIETRRKRSPEEMKQIEDLAMAAVGFNSARGDRLSVQNISFTGISSEGGPSSLPERLAPVVREWNGVFRYLGLAVLFFFIYWLVLRPVKRQIIVTLASEQPQLRSGVLEQVALGEPGIAVQELGALAGEGATASLGLPAAEPSISPEIEKALNLKGQLIEKIKNDPEAASRLIQNWIRQKPRPDHA